MRTMMIGFRILTALVLVALLIGGGVLLYRAGWSQGYLAASAARPANGSSGSIVPSAPGYLPYGPVFFPGLFFPFGFLFTGLLIFFAGFFLLRLIFLPFRMAAWGAHRHGGWHEGWEGHPTTPWMKEKPGEEGKGETDQDHSSESKP